MLPVYLLTDFGTADEFVAVVKAVIRAPAPGIVTFDITHDIPPFDIRKAAVTLAAAAPWFEPGVFMAVVDPGVGTERRVLLLECGRGDLLLGPDNGLLLPAAGRLGGISAAWSVEAGNLSWAGPPHLPRPGRLRAGGGPPGRGVASRAGGPRVDVSFWPHHPGRRRGKSLDALCCQVIDVDRFGNLRLGVEAAKLEGRAAAGDKVVVEIGEAI